jgi:CheY-like chemotaxis protein
VKEEKEIVVQNTGGRAGEPATALVADDDAEFRAVLVDFLRAEGFDVAEAANGLETLLHVKRHGPRVVVLDVHMPRLGGLDALRRIRAWDPSITVLVVSGMPDDELRRQADLLGAAGFFAKPLDFTRLLEVIRGQMPQAPAVPNAGPAPARSPDEAPTRPSPAAGRVLVVDDDAEIRASVADLLRDAGYLVQEAADGAAAIRAVVTTAPDLVLLDIEMPGLSGVEALRTIRAVAPAARVVMLTGNSDSELARSALAFGAFDYIPKPFEPSHLLRIAEAVMAYRALDAEGGA